MLSVGLTTYTQPYQREPMWGAAMAASTVATLPIACLFVFFQRYFVEGPDRRGGEGMSTKTGTSTHASLAPAAATRWAFGTMSRGTMAFDPIVGIVSL